MALKTDKDSLQSLVQLLNDTQIKYRRLHLSDYTNELAPRPASVSVKLQLPSLFKSLFNEQCNISTHSVSGKKFSLWHCLLYVMYPNFIDKTWYDRKKIVDKFIDELNREVDGYFQKDQTIKNTTLSSVDAKFHELLASETLLYFLASLFNINIIVVDTIMIHFIYRDIEFKRDDPTVILYQDDSPTYHVIAVDDHIIFSSRDPQDDHNLAKLYELVPKVNPILQKHTNLQSTTDAGKQRKIEVYSTVNKLTPQEKFELEVKPGLQKLKLVELQALVKKCGLSHQKQGKTKQVNMTKKELIATVINHHKN